MAQIYPPQQLLAAIRAIDGDDALARLLSGYMISTNPDMEESFVWIVAGPGEIHYYVCGDMVGQAWFLIWDQTHALDYEEELDIPEGLTVLGFARWMLAEAKKRDEVDFGSRMDPEDVQVIEIGARAYYTGDTLAELIPRIRQARIFAIREARRQALLRRNPQDAYVKSSR